MTAWDILLQNSTAADGSTAWVHLNSQEGGGGFAQAYLTPVDHLKVDISEKPINITFNEMKLAVEYPRYVEDSPAGNLDIKMEIIK